AIIDGAPAEGAEVWLVNITKNSEYRTKTGVGGVCVADLPNVPAGFEQGDKIQVVIRKSDKMGVAVFNVGAELLKDVGDIMGEKIYSSMDMGVR
ncbi:MAG: hypothetical protein DRI61_12495, partial [Chloroflexi bacterium]